VYVPLSCFPVSCMYVRVTCACVECVGAASMSAVGCPVSRLLSEASVSAGGGPASQLLRLALGLLRSGLYFSRLHFRVIPFMVHVGGKALKTIRWFDPSVV